MQIVMQSHLSYLEEFLWAEIHSTWNFVLGRNILPSKFRNGSSCFAIHYVDYVEKLLGLKVISV